MAIFLRVGAWYRATNKALPSDIEITGIIDDPNAQYPTSDEIQDGGATPTLDAVLAVVPATLTEDRTVDLDGHQLIFLGDTVYRVANDHGIEIRNSDNLTKIILAVGDDDNGIIEINSAKVAVETAANGTFTTITSITVVNGIITEITGT